MVHNGFKKFVDFAGVYDIQQPLVCKRALEGLYCGYRHLRTVISAKDVATTTKWWFIRRAL